VFILSKCVTFLSTFSCIIDLRDLGSCGLLDFCVFRVLMMICYKAYITWLFQCLLCLYYHNNRMLVCTNPVLSEGIGTNTSFELNIIDDLDL